LREALVRADRANRVEGFHNFMESLRGMYGEGLPPLPAWSKIDAYCEIFWHERTQIVGPSDQNRQDLTDLAVIWTDLRVRRATKDASAARRRALTVLEDTEKLCGPTAVLYRERAAHAAALGMGDVATAAMKRAESLPLNTAWEHYAVGRGFLRDGNLERAEAAFDRALRLKRGDLWPNFCRGKCAYQRKHFDEALMYFSICVALVERAYSGSEAARKTSALPWCLTNEGLAYAALGKGEQALDDFNKALELDGTLTVAVLNRGLVHFRAGRYELALTDLKKALKLGSNPAEVHHDLALVYLAQGNRAAARASVLQALQDDPTYPAAGVLAERLKREP
jgi:tetratricopeptide (TPR) repeat protein